MIEEAEDVTLGEILFKDIEKNEYLNEIYDGILFNHGVKLLRLDIELRELDISHALRFADILSKSVSQTSGDRHRIWAQEIVSLLDFIYGGNPMISFYLGSVLTVSGNYQGLAIKETGYDSPGVLDRLYDHYKREYFRVPAAPEKYFIQSQKMVYDHFERPYFSYSGPTSMGKSFVMQMFIKQKVTSGEKGNFCILVPSKALINEVSHDLSVELGNLLFSEDYRIVTSAGSYILQVEEHNYLFVMTPERLMYLLIAFEDMPIEYVFVDEAQKISAPEGRSTFYYQVVGMLYDRERKPHFVFASPNIPNPDVYLQLVPHAVRDSDSVFASSYAPVSQTKFLLDFLTGEIKYYNEHTQALTLLSAMPDGKTMNDFIRECGEGSKCVVYCKNPDDVVTLALEYAGLLQPLHISDLDALAEDIKNEVHSAYYLAETISKGVAYHMGYLPTTIRLRIEESFRKKEGIRVLFCTSTLLEGVNLPADNLFITHYNKGGKPMSAIDFKNLTGRVGRIQYNLYGNVFLVRREKSVEPMQYVELLKKEVEPQALSVGSLRPEYKEYVVRCLLAGEGKLEKQDGQTGEEFSLMRKFANILLRDILQNRNGRVREEFREYLTPENLQTIRDSFLQKKTQPDDDINISLDQREKLVAAIEGGAKYPRVDFNGYIDFKEALAFLEMLHDAFSWDVYEKETLGNKNRLKKYVMLLKQWIRGDSLSQIIDEDVKFRNDKKRPVYLSSGKETFDGSKPHINAVIKDNLDMINDILLFRMANYFLRFSMEYKRYHNKTTIGYNDWYEFVEYGTYIPVVIFLQKSGFSREAASFLFRNQNLFMRQVDGQWRVRNAAKNCGNATASRESREISLNIPELFVD